MEKDIKKLLKLKKLLQSYLLLSKKENITSPKLVEYIGLFKQVKTALNDTVDEELYKLWVAYKKVRENWKTNLQPQFFEWQKANKALTESFLKELIDCLLLLIKTADAFITKYKGSATQISEKMQAKFEEWYKITKKDLEDGSHGWRYLESILSPRYQTLKTDKNDLKQIEDCILSFQKNTALWKSRVIPNFNALLIEQEDVDIVQTIHDKLQILLQILQNASAKVLKEVKDYKDWITLAQKPTWKNRLIEIKTKLQESNDKRNSTLQNGNPELEKKNSKYSYQAANLNNPLFKKANGDKHKVAANDVVQGDLDDCFVLGSIATLAKNMPNDLEKLITPQKDGSFEVTLYLRTDPDSDKRTATIIKVKNNFAVDPKSKKDAFAKKGDDNELWVQVLEKAYAQAMGGYDGINKGGTPIEALQVFTGKISIKGKIQGEDKKQAELLTLFEDVLNNKTPCTLSTIESNISDDTILPDGQKLIYNHVYYLDKVKKRKIWLLNPHGKDHLKIDWKTLFQYFDYYTKL